jgi:hypothetical protein
MKISITFRDDQLLAQTWFGSGIAQNLKFYYDLFEQMGHCVSFLVNQKIGIEHGGKIYKEATREAVLSTNQSIDIIIEAGVVIPAEEQRLYRENCGARIIGLRCGHQYFTATEGLLTRKNLPTNLFSSGHDAMWILPHHGEQQEWLSILQNCPVDVVPYIWEADFVVDQAWADAPNAKPDIVVMEPNISVAKNALVPLVTLQRLYERSPNSFAKALIYNAREFASEENFLYNFVDKLSVLQAHNEKVYFEPRRRFDEIFSQARVLLSHQFNNELNYLYNEAIFLGIALVHNSPPYRQMGYYYKGMRADQAARSLELALEGHDRVQAKVNGREFLKRYSIHNESVQSRYNELLNSHI